MTLSASRRSQVRRTSTHWYLIVENSDVPLGGLLGVVNLDLLRGLLQADMSHRGSILAIEDLGDLFEGRALGFWEHEVHPDGLDKVPKLETQSSVLNHIKPEWWGLTV
jgi:hypothetical protein